MYWPLLAASVLLAIACFQFGSMAVWITVLSITLKAVLLAVAIIAVAVGVMFLWQRFKESKQE